MNSPTNRKVVSGSILKAEQFSCYKLHIHMLRKWFLSQSKLAVPESVAEAWAGHTGYLDEAYRRYSKEQLRELYKKAEPYLLVSVPRDVAEIQSKFQSDLSQLREQVINLTMTNTRLLNENIILKERLSRAEEMLVGIKEELRRLVEPV